MNTCRYAQRPFRANRDVELYRQLRFGSLLEMNVLDTRKYRTDQPCGDGTKALCEAALDAKGTILGARQKRWLKRNLDRSTARWNVLAQQVMMTALDMEPGEGRKILVGFGRASFLCCSASRSAAAPRTAPRSSETKILLRRSTAARKLSIKAAITPSRSSLQGRRAFL